MIGAIVFGLLLGVISGLIPSLGSASIILITLPWFMAMEPINALYAYLAIVISTQYLGSVTAIYTGIPGTEASVPTAREYATIRRFKLSFVAILQNAQASLAGNLIGLLLFILVLPLLADALSLYKNTIKLGILVTTFLVIILVNEKRFRALLSVVLGGVLISLGYDLQTFETFNLGLSIFDNGISWVVLLMGSLVGSGLNQLRVFEKPVDPIYDRVIYKPEIKRPVIQGGILGFIIGFVPGLSYILSSMMAYTVEKHISRKQSEPKRTLSSIAASESAQSSGSVSMLIPFLLFSIPITASEGVIMNVVTMKVSLEEVFFQLTENKLTLLLVFVGINLSAYVIAMTCRGLVRFIFSIPTIVIQCLLALTGVLAVVFSTNVNIGFELVAYAAVILFFYKTRLDPLPFIMSVLLWPTLQTSLYLFKELL